jgi:hypothetical protein
MVNSERVIQIKKSVNGGLDTVNFFAETKTEQAYLANGIILPFNEDILYGPGRLRNILKTH